MNEPIPPPTRDKMAGAYWQHGWRCCPPPGRGFGTTPTRARRRKERHQLRRYLKGRHDDD